MAKKKLSNDNIAVLVYAIVLFVLGVLFCCTNFVDVISTIIGVVFIVAGAAFILVSLIQEKSIITGSALLGGLLIAIGIACIVDGFIGAILNIVIWAMIVLGAVLIVDSILRITVRKDKNMLAFGIELGLGVISFVLGMCLKFVPEFGEYVSIVLGVLLILYAVYLILTVFVMKKSKK